MLLVFSLQHDQKITTVVLKESCYEDLPYNISDEWNTYSLAHPWFKDLLLIFDDLCFDVTICSLLYLFRNSDFNGTSCFFAFLFNVLCKGYVQDNLLTIQ